MPWCRPSTRARHRDKSRSRSRFPPASTSAAAAEDIRSGAAVLEPGRSLRPQDLGLLASLGIAEVSVVAEPRVRIIVTGNEVVESRHAERRASDLRREFRDAARPRRARRRRRRRAPSSRRRSCANTRRADRGRRRCHPRFRRLERRQRGSRAAACSPRSARSRSTASRCGLRAPRAWARSAIRSCSCFREIPFRVFARTTSSPGEPSGSAVDGAPSGRIARGRAWSRARSFPRSDGSTTAAFA